MSIAVVVGNPKPRSRTYQAALQVARRLGGGDPELVVDLVDIADQLLDWSSIVVARTVANVQASSLIVFASPTYKGTFTGLLKLFLDRVPSGSLAGSAATVPIMLGGDKRHSLAPEVFLKPVLTELGACCPTPGLFLLESGWDDPAELETWLERSVPLLQPWLVGAR